MRSFLMMISLSAGTPFVASSTSFAAEAVAPGPVAAVGMPALLAIGGAFLAVRYFRSRGK